jgi:protease PrsW
LVAVVLHTLWDTFASSRSGVLFDFLGLNLLSLVVALLSLTLLIRRVREARRSGPKSTAHAT